MGHLQERTLRQEQLALVAKSGQKELGQVARNEQVVQGQLEEQPVLEQLAEREQQGQVLQVEQEEVQQLGVHEQVAEEQGQQVPGAAGERKARPLLRT